MRVETTEKKAFIAACLCLVIGGLGFRVAMAELKVYLQRNQSPCVLRLMNYQERLEIGNRLEKTSNFLTQ